MARLLARLRLRVGGAGYLGVALLLAVTLGLSLFSLAGARRTQSAFPAVLEAGSASDLAVSSSAGFDPATTEAIAALPQVEQSRINVGYISNLLSADGQADFDTAFDADGTDGRFFDQDRFLPTEGRMADPDVIDEVVVNQSAAERYGWEVGQHLRLGTYTPAAIFSPTFFSDTPPADVVIDATIVGIGLFPEEVVQDETDKTARLLYTPAFYEANADLAAYSTQGLALRGGADDVAQVAAAITDLVPPGSIEFAVTSEDTERVQHAVRPLSVALATFGGIVGLAALALTAQALSARLRDESQQRHLLRAFGLDRGALLGTSLLVPFAAVLAGALTAIGLAVAASPLMPIGPVRPVSPGRGVDADLTVLLGGAAAAVSILALFTVVTVWRTLPHRRRARAGAHRSRITRAAAAAGAGPAMFVGVGFAVGADGTDDRARSWSVVGGAALAIGALAAAITFGSSLQTLVREPRLYGWDWDAALLSGGGYDHLDPAATDETLAEDPDVQAWSGAYIGYDTIDGEDVPLLGLDPSSDVAPPVVAGRMIAGDDEIALGEATAQSLGVGIGDTLTLQGDQAPHEVEVVGIVTFPAIGAVHAANTTLGTGGLVVPALVPGYDRTLTGERGGPDLGPHVAFVRFDEGADTDAALARLRETTPPLGGIAGVEVFEDPRPAEIVNANTLGSVPTLLAATLAAGAIVSLTLALGSSVRRRRNELGILKSLGFTPGQLGASVSWHATTTVVLGAALGVPAGVVLGRLLWALFAEQLDVVVEPTVPLVALTGLVLGALVVANLVAAVPALAARRVPAGVQTAPRPTGTAAPDPVGSANSSS